MNDFVPYLGRLGMSFPLEPDLETLRRLHARHMRSIPFENSSVLYGDDITLDESLLVQKLGRGGRGGFCYELNGAFAALLRDIGYDVAYLQARTYTGATVGEPFEHLALRVDLDGPWLVDVGFGYSFAEPLRLVAGIEQTDPMGAFRLVEAEDGWDLEWRHRDGRWVAHYRVDPVSHALGAFTAMCESLRTSPESIFTQGWLCSRLLEHGGVTLFGRHLIVSDGDSREERDLDDDEELADVLARWFDVRSTRAGDGWTPA